LRPGNVHSAEGWEELLLPEVERQQQQGKAVIFRADAAFAKPELYEALEARDVKYAIRLPANDNLQRNITLIRSRKSPLNCSRQVARTHLKAMDASELGRLCKLASALPSKHLYIMQSSIVVLGRNGRCRGLKTFTLALAGRGKAIHDANRDRWLSSTSPMLGKPGYSLSSSSRAFASLRSAVSKPSVNQA